MKTIKMRCGNCREPYPMLKLRDKKFLVCEACDRALGEVPTLVQSLQKMRQQVESSRAAGDKN